MRSICGRVERGCEDWGFTFYDVKTGLQGWSGLEGGMACLHYDTPYARLKNDMELPVLRLSLTPTSPMGITVLTPLPAMYRYDAPQNVSCIAL